MSPRVFWSVLSVEARKRLGYRADFWVQSFVGFVAEFGLVWFLWRAMYVESGRVAMGGLDLHGMVLYQVGVVLLGKLVRGPEIEGAVSQDIYDGSLSRYLLYPARYPVFKYAQHLGSLLPATVQLVLFGVWFPIALELPEGAGPLSLLAAVPAVLAGNLLYFLMSYGLQSVAFWAENVWSLLVALRLVTTILGGAMVPLAMFPGWARDALWFTPFPYLYAFPVDTLLGQVGPLAWARGIAVTLLWCSVTAAAGRAVFRRGTLQYSGVGM